MAEQAEELKKLVAIAVDFGLSSKLRTKAIDQIAHIDTHDALLALLSLTGNEMLTKGERKLALRRARGLIKSGP